MMAQQNMPDPPEESPQPQSVEPRPAGWFQRVSSVLFIIFCFELGLFLLIYPWTSAWTDNYFAWALPGVVRDGWHTFWNNSYVRGGISGLGIVNVWIALSEVFNLFGRRSPHPQTKG
jgi:hypothetical protein